jgi:hypothetical protein
VLVGVIDERVDGGGVRRRITDRVARSDGRPESDAKGHGRLAVRAEDVALVGAQHEGSEGVAGGVVDQRPDMPAIVGVGGSRRAAGQAGDGSSGGDSSPGEQRVLAAVRPSATARATRSIATPTAA